MARAPLSRRRRQRRRRRIVRVRSTLSRWGALRFVRARSPPSRQGPRLKVRRTQLLEVALGDVTAQRDRRLTHTRQGRRFPRQLAKALKEAGEQPRAPLRRATAVDSGGYRVIAGRSPAGEEERGGRDADSREEEWDFSQGGFVRHELQPRRRAARGDGGGSSLHGRGEHSEPVQEAGNVSCFVGHQDPPPHTGGGLGVLAQDRWYPKHLAKAFKEAGEQSRAPPRRTSAVGGAPYRVFAGGSSAGEDERGRGEGDDPCEATDEIDEANRIKNKQAAAELLQELQQELNLLLPPPPTSTPSHFGAAMPEASGALLLTVSTRDDAREAVALASDAMGIRILVSHDVALEAAEDINSILRDGRVQNAIVDPAVLASKVSQANWLMKEIENAEIQLERLQMLLHQPWLP